MNDGRFRKGVRTSRATEFKKGEHWRRPQPFRERSYLDHEYVTKGRSCGDIAREFGVTDGAIQLWLKRHGIAARSVSQARKLKRWGVCGDKNPMFGRRGPESPAWKGGVTPARQALYSTAKWRSVARRIKARDRSCRLCTSIIELEIHHIMPFSEAPDLAMEDTNLIRLCAKCHRPMKNREAAWAPVLSAILMLDRQPDTPGFAL